MNIYCKSLINPRFMTIFSINNGSICRRLLNNKSSFTKQASFQTNVGNKNARETHYEEYLRHVNKKKALMSKRLERKNNLEKNTKNDIKFSPLFKPISIEPNESTEESNIGEELVGKLEKCLKFTFFRLLNFKNFC